MPSRTNNWVVDCAFNFSPDSPRDGARLSGEGTPRPVGTVVRQTDEELHARRRVREMKSEFKTIERSGELSFTPRRLRLR